MRYLLSAVLLEDHSSSNFKALRDFFDSGKEESAGALGKGEGVMLSTRRMVEGMSGEVAVPVLDGLLQYGIAPRSLAAEGGFWGGRFPGYSRCLGCAGVSET